MNLIKKHPFLAGTVILAFTGVLTRIIGFLYRMYLLETFGAEQLGVYQLITPVLVLSYACCISGIQVAISKHTAASPKKNNITSASYLKVGLCLSLIISFIASILLYRFSDAIAIHILKEARTSSLIRIAAFTVPADAVHSCINGYYYGCKKTMIPAISQLIEQIVRVLSVWVICSFLISENKLPLIGVAVLGLLIGEIASLFFSSISLAIKKTYAHSSSEQHVLTKILRMALPITGNRVIVNLFVSAETILIPTKLRLFGMSASDALIEYGLLTGMVMPLLLFPGAFVNSACILLLPTISEAQAKGETAKMNDSVKKAYSYSILFGLLCFLLFLIFGRATGNLLFHSDKTGEYITILSILCPFLYLSTISVSILNGIGRTLTTFLISISGLLIRIVFVWFLIPKTGTKGYLWGLLVSQLFVSILGVLSVCGNLKSRPASK